MALRERAGKWHYRFKVNGKEYAGNTDLAATKRNESAANRRESKARELVIQGRFKELKLKSCPFNDAAGAFIDWATLEHKDKPNTSLRLKTSFASLKEYFKTTPVLAVTRGEIKNYMTWRRKDHCVEEITLRHDLHALSKAFKFWIDQGWACENLVEGIDIPSDKDAVRMHVLSLEEERAYFLAAKKFPDLYDVGRLILLQGCRPEEIMSLEKAQVDLQAGEVQILKGKSLAAKRVIYLVPESIEILSARMADSHSKQWVFPTRRNFGQHLAKLQRPHDKALELTRECGTCRKLRIEHAPYVKTEACLFQASLLRVECVLYDLRHTFATRKAEEGMALSVLAAILGHGDLRSISKYVHVRSEVQKLAMKKFS
jgi:site-specific recombinase XerD